MHKGLDLDSVYANEAIDLVTARAKAKVIHRTSNIRASGNEVEIAARKFISARIPSQCRVAQGHMLDIASNVTPQLDVIVAENLYAKPLWETSDGTEYVPCESVYAVGEVKTSYVGVPDEIQRFSETLVAVDGLRRKCDVKTPIFSFMLFVDSEKLDLTRVESFYATTPADQLPGLVCFLDKGIVFRSTIMRTSDGKAVPTKYHLYPKSVGSDETKWIFRQGESSQNLMWLTVLLLQHIQQTELEPADLQLYLIQNFSAGAGVVFRENC